MSAPRFVVRPSWDGQDFGSGRAQTWDVVDRETRDAVVANFDTRDAARADARDRNGDPITAFETETLRRVAAHFYLVRNEVAAARRLEARGLVELEDNGEKPSDWSPRRSDGERWTATLTEAGEAHLKKLDGRS